MDKIEDLNSQFGSIIQGLKEAESLLDTNLLDEHKSHMSSEDLAQYTKMKQLTGVDLERAAKSLIDLDKKYDKKPR